MGYCVLADIQNDFKQSPNAVFQAGATVTDTAINGFIAEASALIDGYVGQRWVTPVTGANSLTLMSLFCRTLVADRVRGILANKQQTNTDANAQVKSDGYSVKDVMKSLNDIALGNMQLADAVLLNATAGFFSNNYQSNVQPRFNKGRRQW